MSVLLQVTGGGVMGIGSISATGGNSAAGGGGGGGRVALYKVRSPLFSALILRIIYQFQFANISYSRVAAIYRGRLGQCLRWLHDQRQCLRRFRLFIICLLICPFV